MRKMAVLLIVPLCLLACAFGARAQQPKPAHRVHRQPARPPGSPGRQAHRDSVRRREEVRIRKAEQRRRRAAHREDVFVHRDVRVGSGTRVIDKPVVVVPGSAPPAGAVIIQRAAPEVLALGGIFPPPDPGRTSVINPKDGAVMVFIPAGPFLMGNDKHTETTEAYYIYATPVTVAQYEAFCKATRTPMPKAPEFDPTWEYKDHPMVNVRWLDAAKYCAWAGVTLPTEKEFEKAARGTDGRDYPWGDGWNPAKCAYNTSNGTVAVGQYDESPYGLSDMAGNVWQWCADEFEVGTGHYVLRGASWASSNPDFFRADHRHWHRWQTLKDVGFRCAARSGPN
jgi:serine/threonine-protein kinase